MAFPHDYMAAQRNRYRVVVVARVAAGAVVVAAGTVELVVDRVLQADPHVCIRPSPRLVLAPRGPVDLQHGSRCIGAAGGGERVQRRVRGAHASKNARPTVHPVGVFRSSTRRSSATRTGARSGYRPPRGTGRRGSDPRGCSLRRQQSCAARRPGTRTRRPGRHHETS